jgi:hypothetical protein
MCSYIVKKAALAGAQRPQRLDDDRHRNIYYDHPYHAPFDHTLNIDFVNAANGGRDASRLSSGRAARSWSAGLAALARRSTARGRRADEDAPAYLSGLRRAPPSSHICVAGCGSSCPATGS